jgi:hypothetical protein
VGKVNDIIESLAQVQATSLHSDVLSDITTRHTLCQTPDQVELPPALKLLEFSLVGFALGAGGACITADGWGDLPVDRFNFTVDDLLPVHVNKRVFWGQLGTLDDLASIDSEYKKGNLLWSSQASSTNPAY